MKIAIVGAGAMGCMHGANPSHNLDFPTLIGKVTREQGGF
jgi:hypothetical protein